MELTGFSEKYNKVSGKIYVVEEECRPDNGVYEAELQHDNINVKTLTIYTGRKLTGKKINKYTLSTPSLAPWKRIISIYTTEPVVYVSYETEGDTVEAEDINRVQDAILNTQEALNEEADRAKQAEQVLEDDLETESSRASAREKELDTSIKAEASRAKTEEGKLNQALSTEQARAETAENLLKEGLTEEQQRATLRENVIEGSINREIQRAQQAEQDLSADIAAEGARAEAAEKETSDGLNGEIARAKAAEKKNADNLALETTRATNAESTINTALSKEVDRAKAAESSLSQTINTNKPIWDDKYTKNEVDNKFSVLESNIDWKESVNTFADISTTYPTPQDGWTVNVKDTDYTYRWNGSSWIAISANSIPKATSSVDGLLSKGDKVLYDDAVAKKHNHSNQSILDAITQAIVNGWNSAVTHISDAVKHITAAERTNWTDAYNKRHDHGNKTVLDAITQAIVDKWNTVSNKVDKETGKGLSSNDYTTAEKTKLAGIAAGAEVNMQADWNVSDTASDAYIKNKPTSMPASDVAAWAKSPSKPTYVWTEIGSRPTKVSQFTNDSGFITSADIDTSQNHTHGNKIVLDKITQALLDTWNTVANKVDKETGKGLSTNDYSTAEKTKLSGIAAGANNYVHPSTSGNKHVPTGGASGQILRWSADGTAVWGADNNSTYGIANATNPGLVKSGTDISVDSAGNVSVIDDSHNHIISNVDGLQTALDGKSATSHTHNYAGSSTAGGAATSALVCTGNSATSTKLQTARTINGTAFNGSANITTANWGTSRNIKIGDTSKVVNGSGDIAWTLGEMGTLAVKAHIITPSFMSEFRAQTTGTPVNEYISVIRSNSTVTEAPQYGSGLAFGHSDTHGYIYTHYSYPQVWVGGGNAGKLNWAKSIAFSDHTHSKADITSALGYTPANNTDLQACFQSASDGKAKIAAAITGKGVTTSAVATYDVMAANIRNIAANFGINGNECRGAFNCTNSSSSASVTAQATIPTAGTYIVFTEYDRFQWANQWTEYNPYHSVSTNWAVNLWNQEGVGILRIGGIDSANGKHGTLMGVGTWGANTTLTATITVVGNYQTCGISIAAVRAY